MNNQRLFLASCIALAATSMSFAIRGDIMLDFEMVFGLDKSQVGWIAGAAFFSFGLAILFGGPLVDLLGMGTLLRFAALCHVGGTVLTIFAPEFWTLFFATLVVGAGNGLVEAVCNPLIATIYPTEKQHKLTLFHAWFPGGVVIGGVLAFLLTRIGSTPEGAEVMALGGIELWKIKMALLFVPSFIYLFMIWTEKFPPTERSSAGIPFSEMFTEAIKRPLFIMLFFMMWLTAATELGAGQWITNVYNDVMTRLDADALQAGVLFLVWGNGLMFILRQFFSKPAHKLSPVLLIGITAPLAAAGLYLMGDAQGPLMFFVASSLLYVGVAYWWPTMLGITSERCPKTGAFGLAFIGATGSFATFFAGPILGEINERYGPREALQVWAIPPIIIMIVFIIMFLRDRAKGGYRIEVLEQKKELVEEGLETET